MKGANDSKVCVQFSDEVNGHIEAISTFSVTQDQEYLLYLKIGLGFPHYLNILKLHSNSSSVFLSSKMQLCLSLTLEKETKLILLNVY